MVHVQIRWHSPFPSQCQFVVYTVCMGYTEATYVPAMSYTCINIIPVALSLTLRYRYIATG